jgi:hypothetical protein
MNGSLYTAREAYNELMDEIAFGLVCGNVQMIMAIRCENDLGTFSSGSYQLSQWQVKLELERSECMSVMRDH